jgi:hypothetical protein
VQGRLRRERLSVEVRSECAHCSQALNLTIDDELNVDVREDTEPLIFVPEVDFFDLDEPSIVEVF